MCFIISKSNRAFARRKIVYKVFVQGDRPGQVFSPLYDRKRPWVIGEAYELHGKLVPESCGEAREGFYVYSRLEVAARWQAMMNREGRHCVVKCRVDPADLLRVAWGEEQATYRRIELLERVEGL